MGRIRRAKWRLAAARPSNILGNQCEGCAVARRLWPEPELAHILGCYAPLRLKSAGAVCRSYSGMAAKKRAASPRKGSGPQDLRSADQRLSKRLCCWTTVLRETRIGSCDRLTMSTAAECTTATKNDPAGGAGRPPLPATGGLRRRRLKLLPIAIANGRRGCTHCHAPRCRRGHGGTCSRARRRPLVAHSAGDG